MEEAVSPGRVMMAEMPAVMPRTRRSPVRVAAERVKLEATQSALPYPEAEATA